MGKWSSQWTCVFSKIVNGIAKIVNAGGQWVGRRGHGLHEGCGCAVSVLFAVLTDCTGHCLLEKERNNGRNPQKAQNGQ